MSRKTTGSLVALSCERKQGGLEHGARLSMALLTMALLTMANLTIALLTMALLTMALLTMALLTMALLTMALLWLYLAEDEGGLETDGAEAKLLGALRGLGAVGVRG